MLGITDFTPSFLGHSSEPSGILALLIPNCGPVSYTGQYMNRMRPLHKKTLKLLGPGNFLRLEVKFIP